MNTIIFEKDEKVKAISLETLKETLSLAEANGKLPSSRPIEHFQLVDMVLEKLDKANMKADPEPIWISKADSKRLPILDPDNNGTVKSWLFQRLAHKINIKVNGGNENFTPSIGIGYNANGLTLAWGLNVKVCSNMSILGQTLVSTYGTKKMPFEKIENVFNDWVAKCSEKYFADVNIMEQMQKIPIDKKSGVPELIGRLHMRAIEQAYIDSKIQAPLNVSQVSTFDKEYLTKYAYEDTGESTSLYDLYNIGTNILKPRQTEIAEIWQDNANFGDFMIAEYMNN